MAVKNQFVLPKEYEGQIIVPEDYYSKRREEALKNARNRTNSYAKPAWWKNEVNGRWKDCISTATNNYGEANTVTGNATFYANPEKFGFKRLADGESLLPGDIVQAYTHYDGQNPGRPYHGYMINELDGDGKIKSVNYSDGYGGYHVGTEDWWPENSFETGNGRTGQNKQYRYRYVGTPAEQQAIAEHNAAIRAKNSASVQPIPVPVQGISVQPAQLPKRRLTIFDIAKGAE